jgi:hypothetical protein
MLYKSYTSRMLVLNNQSLIIVLHSEYSEDFPITNNVDNSRHSCCPQHQIRLIVGPSNMAAIGFKWKLIKIFELDYSEIPGSYKGIKFYIFVTFQIIEFDTLFRLSF